MVGPNNEAIRRDAREVFERFLASAEGEPEFASFLDEQDPALRTELEEIIADYRLLTDMQGEDLPPIDGGRMGDFRLIEEIGRGGMGVIWEAEQLSLRRHVAVKVLYPHYSLNEDVVGRFHREAEAGARIRHPGIVSVFAAGEHDGRYFIAQELISEGYTLADRIKDLRDEDGIRPTHYRECAELFAQLADALQAAHDVGVIHRDIKPSNILMGPEGRPKIADFGLAKVQDDLGFSRTGQLLGTPFYMSPEQAASARTGLDHRTDIFSLGATFYEMLTLRRPFEGDTSQQVLGQILLTDPVDPTKLRSRCPAELAVICLKAMEKQPQHRYQTAKELRDDLQRFLEHRTILARPPSPVRRVRKWVYRHPSWAVGIVGTAVAVTVITALLIQTQRARKTAETQATLATLEAEHAKASAQNLEEVAVFVTDVFRGQLLSRTLREVAESKGFLEAAEQEVLSDSKLTEEARTQRLEIVGRLYNTIGLHEKAEELLRRGLEWRESSFGSEDLRTVHTEVLLAEALMGLERAGEAREIALRVEQTLVSAGRTEDLDLLSARQVLGRGHLQERELEKADETLTSVLSSRRALLGETHPDTLESLVSLAHLRYESNRNDEADALLLEASKHCLVEGQNSDRRHLVLRTLRELYEAQVSTRVEPTPEELQQIERSLRVYEPIPVLFSGLEAEFDRETFLAILPTVARNLNDGPGTLADIGQAANRISEQGRTGEALLLFTLVLSAMQEVHGPAYHDTVVCIGNLANAYTDLRRYETAAPYHRRNVTLNHHLLGSQHLFTLIGELWYSQNECFRENYAEAEAKLPNIAQRAEQTAGENHWITLMAMVELARVYLNTDRLDQALPILEFAHESLQENYGAANPYTAAALALYRTAQDQGPVRTD